MLEIGHNRPEFRHSWEAPCNQFLVHCEKFRFALELVKTNQSNDKEIL